MASEDWAQRIVANALGRNVVINDDGSAPSMYDLRVEAAAENESIAIECVGAVNSDFTELWNIGPAKGPLSLKVRGDWIVEIAIDARLKKVKANLEAILQDLEANQILNAGDHLRNDTTTERMGEIGVAYAHQVRPNGTGKIVLTLPPIGGAVNDEGTGISDWVETFIRQPEQGDVISKLRLSSLMNQEIFIVLGFSGAPFHVESYFGGDLKMLPAGDPNVSENITGVWLASSIGYKGIRWNKEGWSFFDIR